MKFTAFKYFGSNLAKLNVLATGNNSGASEQLVQPDSNSKFNYEDIWRTGKLILPNLNIVIQNLEKLIISAYIKFNENEKQEKELIKINDDFDRDFNCGESNCVFKTLKFTEKEVCNNTEEVKKYALKIIFKNALLNIKSLKFILDDFKSKKYTGSNELDLIEFDNIDDILSKLCLFKMILTNLDALLDYTLIKILIFYGQGKELTEKYMFFLIFKRDIQYLVYYLRWRLYEWKNYNAES